MVLPIDPSNIPINPTTGHANPAGLVKDVFTTQTNYRIPDVPPPPISTPNLTVPENISMVDYSLMVNTALSRMKKMLYYGNQVDELITTRFYSANLANVTSFFSVSVSIVNDIYQRELANANYLTYLQGLNDNVPVMNAAIEAYTPGLTDEEQNIQTINDAISTFLNNPVSQPTVDTLNAAVAVFNAYASVRNVDIQNYNNEVNAYNANVAVINSAIQTFNLLFIGEGVLRPLPLLPTAVLRDPLPTLPDANLVDPYQPTEVPFQPFEPFLNTVILELPSVVGIPAEINPPASSFPEINGFFTNLNTSISTYNSSVGDPITPSPGTENSAIQDLNAAISAYNADPTQATLDALVAANTAYSAAIASMDANINSLNAEVDAFNTGTGPNTLGGLNDEINAINVARAFYGLPSIPNYSEKPHRTLMPAPLTLNPTFGQNPVFFNLLPTRINYSTVPEMSQIEIDAVYVLSLGETETFVIKQIVSVILSRLVGIRSVEKLLKNIENFAQIQREDLDLDRQLANAYSPLPDTSIGSIGSVSLAAMSIGLSSVLFEQLLSTMIFRSMLSLFQLPYSESVMNALRGILLETVSKAALLAAPSTSLTFRGKIPPPTLEDLHKTVSTPVAPVFALNFIDQIRNLVGSGAVPTLVRGTFGGRVSGEKLDYLSTAFNIALLNTTLSLLGRVFGTRIIPAILSQAPSIVPFISPISFGEAMGENRSAIRSKIVSGLQGLTGSSTSLANQIMNQLTNPSYTPVQFFNQLKFLLNKATGQKNLPALHSLAFEATAYIFDQLPSAITNRGILGTTIDASVIQQGGLGQALLEARASQLAGEAPNPNEMNLILSGVKADLIRKNAIRDSIIKQNALAFRERQDAIRRDLINSQAIAQAEADQGNTVGSVRDSIRSSQQTAEDVDRFDLANRAVEALIQNDLVKRAALKYDLLQGELAQRRLIDESSTNRVLELQREFGRQAVASATDALGAALQNVFNLSSAEANAIAQSVNLAPTNNIPALGNSQAPDALRGALFQLLKDRLVQHDVETAHILFGLLQDRVVQLIHLIEDNVKKVAALNDVKLNRVMTERFRDLFKEQDDLAKFVENRLLAPAYSLVYCTNASPMYAKPEEHKNYVANVDIHI